MAIIVSRATVHELPESNPNHLFEVTPVTLVSPDPSRVPRTLEEAREQAADMAIIVRRAMSHELPARDVLKLRKYE
jgi:hypothetical protein